MYDQQAQFYIYEAEEVASIIKNEKSSNLVNERLSILSKFLDANLIIYNESKEIDSIQYSKEKLPIKLNQNFINELWQGENIIYTGQMDDNIPEIFLAAIPIIEDNNNVTGAVVIYSPINSLKQHIYGVTKISLWVALLGIIFVTLLSIFIVKNLTKPLLEMEDTARSIAEGDFGKKVPITSNDEVGRLASSLNHMSVELKEKIDAIEKLDRIRREFVSNVSHELRTPLTIIQSFSEAILDGLVKSENEKEKYVTNILGESQRLKRLVDDLLELRSLEVGEVLNSNQMEYISIPKLIYVTTENFKRLAKEKKIELIIKPGHEQITVLGHIDRLKQVMTNLLGNAITYTLTGGKIIVSWGKSNNKNEVFITVEDNGPGIPEDELDSIWERFYKVDKSRSRESQGTGLGLAITKRIIELHNGHVEVKSTVGKGSSFIIYLPIVKD